MDMDYTDRAILISALDYLSKYTDKTLSKKDNNIIKIGAKNYHDIVIKNFHKLRFTKFDTEICIKALTKYSDYLSRSKSPAAKNKLLDAQSLLEEFQEAVDTWEARN